MEKVTGAPPTGCPLPSVTFAIKVEVPDEEPADLEITLGDACTVIDAGVTAVIETDKVSLVVLAGVVAST